MVLSRTANWSKLKAQQQQQQKRAVQWIRLKSMFLICILICAAKTYFCIYIYSSIYVCRSASPLEAHHVVCWYIFFFYLTNSPSLLRSSVWKSNKMRPKRHNNACTTVHNHIVYLLFDIRGGHYTLKHITPHSTASRGGRNANTRGQPATAATNLARVLGRTKAHPYLWRARSSSHRSPVLACPILIEINILKRFVKL